MAACVELCCPACGESWAVPALIAGVWWAPGVTPAAIAARCWCPYCRTPPPMAPAPPPSLVHARSLETAP
jgi:hypothetical protein